MRDKIVFMFEAGTDLTEMGLLLTKKPGVVVGYPNGFESTAAPALVIYGIGANAHSTQVNSRITGGLQDYPDARHIAYGNQRVLDWYHALLKDRNVAKMPIDSNSVQHFTAMVDGE